MNIETKAITAAIAIRIKTEIITRHKRKAVLRYV